MKSSKWILSALFVAANLSGCGSPSQEKSADRPAEVSGGVEQAPAVPCPTPQARADGKRYPQLAELSRLYRRESAQYEDAKSLFDERERTGTEPEDLKNIHPHAIEAAVADMKTYATYLVKLKKAQALCFSGNGDAEVECAVPMRPQMSGFDFFYGILKHIIRSETPQAPECVEVL